MKTKTSWIFIIAIGVMFIGALAFSPANVKAQEIAQSELGEGDGAEEEDQANDTRTVDQCQNEGLAEFDRTVRYLELAGDHSMAEAAPARPCSGPRRNTEQPRPAPPPTSGPGCSWSGPWASKARSCAPTAES